MRDKQILSEEAKQLLENPMLQEAFEKAKEKLVLAAEMSPLNDTEKHHNIVIALQLLRQIKGQIERYISDGVVEEINLKQKKVFNLF